MMINLEIKKSKHHVYLLDNRCSITIKLLFQKFQVMSRANNFMILQLQQFPRQALQQLSYLNRHSIDALFADVVSKTIHF